MEAMENLTANAKPGDRFVFHCAHLKRVFSLSSADRKQSLGMVGKCKTWTVPKKMATTKVCLNLSRCRVDGILSPPVLYPSDIINPFDEELVANYVIDDVQHLGLFMYFKASHLLCRTSRESLLIVCHPNLDQQYACILAMSYHTVLTICSSDDI